MTNSDYYETDGKVINSLFHASFRSKSCTCHVSFPPYNIYNFQTFRLSFLAGGVRPQSEDLLFSFILLQDINRNTCNCISNMIPH